MFESAFPTISDRLRRWFPTLGFGPRWRVSTWWPSDSRSAMQRSLLRLLSVAHTERLELAPLVANLAEEHRGSYRRRLRRLARRLGEGTPLVEAIEQTPDVLRDEDGLAIRFAGQTGTLESTYQDLVDAQEPTSNRVSASLRQTIFYSAATLLMMALVLTFLMIFIVPTFEHMHEALQFADSQSAPWTFSLLITLCNHVANYWPVLMLAVILVAWLICSSPSRRFFRRVVASRWVRGVAEARSAELLRLLAMAVEAGRPLPAALSTLASYHFDKTVRQKLLFARNEVEQGADVWSSLSDARLLTPQESQALALSSSNQSRVWAMRRLADWKREQIGQRMESGAALVQPLVTLLLAAIVLLIASAMIGFLAQLIKSQI